MSNFARRYSDQLALFAMAQRFMLMLYGQSVAVGLLGRPALTTSLPAGHAHVMFNASPRSRDIPSEPVTYASTAPAAEVNNPSGDYGETGVVAAAIAFLVEVAALLGLDPDELGFHCHCATAGRGGASQAQLSPGSSFYTNWNTMDDEARKRANEAGLLYAYLATIFTQGETDQSNGLAQESYRDGLVTLANRMNTAAMARSGQNWRPPFLGMQLGSHLYYHGALNGDGSRQYPDASKTPTIALAQREAMLAHPDIIYIAARYWFSYRDNVHHWNYDYQHIGKMYGRALARLWVARMRGEPDPILALDLEGAHWQADKLLLNLRVPKGALQFDSSWVTPTGTPGKGLDIWSADYSQLLDIIQDVQIVGPQKRSLLLSFSEVPASGVHCTNAFGRTETTTGRESGPRSQICDSDTGDYVDGAGTTRSMKNPSLIWTTTKPDPALSGGEIFA